MPKTEKHHRTPEEQHKRMMSAHAGYWAEQSKIKLRAGNFSFADHEYQIDMFSCDSKVQCVLKGAQMGATEKEVLVTIHGHIMGRYPQGTLYLLPTRDDVTDFSKARFSPLISDNQCISVHVRDTDAANIKRVGSGMLYFRGARSSDKIEGTKTTSSALKSVPVDRIVFDEVDEMEPDMVTLALERISHSRIQEERYLSTPSIPNFGIDALYQKSDQRVWMIPCSKCGKETCLEQEFPKCLVKTKDGDVKRICIHCHDREIFPRDGHWVPQFHGRDMVGWWISQLNSMYVEPKKILHLYHNPPEGNLAEVYNSKLGRAYIPVENELTPQDVLACCGPDAMSDKFHGPAAMGVDVGKQLHVTIGHKKNEKQRRIVKIARVDSFSDVHDLAQRYNVRSAVVDMEPETRAARDFALGEPYPVFLCDYQERLKVGQIKNEDSGVLTVRRTEICDRTHNLVMSKDRLLELPRVCEEVKLYAKQMSNLVKVAKKNSMGIMTYTYIKRSADDHYRHATNYFELACDHYNIRPVSASEIEAQNDRWRRIQGADPYDPLYSNL